MAQPTDYIEGIPSPGEEIAGKYRVERLLGAGGMGAVIAATHLGLGQQVAVKFLLSEAALNPSAIRRFEREARAAAKIQSDHVAKVHDVGKLENGTPYMVMEMLDGEDLSQALERGALPVALAVRCVLEASEALAEAHRLGIVHRDLKPANLFLARRADGSSRIKVLDFGISKDASVAGAQLTRTSALMGSPVYMAPEQMESAKHADARSDIWALGTILYEALTGLLPFRGDTLPEICVQILQSDPPPLRATLPNAPPGLEAVVAKALQKKPADRFQNLAELASALRPYGDEDAARSVAVIQRVLEAAPLPATTSSPRSGLAESLATSVATGPTHLERSDAPMASSSAALSAPSWPGVQSASVAPVGASTAAPMSQTMGSLPRGRSRAGLALAIGIGGLLVGSALAAGLLLSERGASSDVAAPSTDEPSTTSFGAELDPSTSTAEVATGGPAPEHEPDGGADSPIASGDASEPPSAPPPIQAAGAPSTARPPASRVSPPPSKPTASPAATVPRNNELFD